MSYIFDALQRSEAERTGTDFSQIATICELLGQAERQAALQFKSDSLSAQIDRVARADSEPAFVSESFWGATTTDNSASVEKPGTEKRKEIFSHFKTAKVAVPIQSRLVCLSDKQSPAAEAFRLLGLRLQHQRRDRPLHRVLLTSTVPREGKTLSAANLACTLASETAKKVLLIEGDVRRPSLAKMFGLGQIAGLSECLRGEQDVVESILHLEDPNIWMLPAGSASESPLDLLEYGKPAALMNQLAQWFEWIVIDSPPVLPLADASVWARLADGILLVTRQGTTERRQLQRGLEALDQSKLIGCLLNCSTSSPESSYYYYQQPPDSSAT